MLDAYAVRKAIPRLVIAVIGINLSIYLCVAAIDLTMIIGRGMNQLLVTPFVDQSSFNGVGIQANAANTITGVLGLGLMGGAFAAIIASGGAVAIAILGALLPLILLIVLIALAVLFTLVVRQGLLVFLTIASPVAIACFVLPGTEKYFKQWWSLFSKALFVYPIFAIVFAMSNVLSAILLNSNGASTASMLSSNYIMAQASGGAMGTAQIFAVIIVAYAPLAVAPYAAFAAQGGALGAVWNAAKGQASKLGNQWGQSIRKNRQDPGTFLGSRRQRALENRRRAGLTPDQILTGASGAIGARMRGERARTGWRAAVNNRNESFAWQDANRLAEDKDFQMISGNDDTLYALQHGTDAASVSNILRRRGVTDERDNADATAAVMRVMNKTGARTAQIAAARAQFKTGTAHTDAYEFAREIAVGAGGDKNTMGRLVAEGRGSAVQSGRVDIGGASFNETFETAAKVADAMRGGPAFSREEANAKIGQSVIEANAGMNLIGSHVKPQAVREAGKQWQIKLARVHQDYREGKATKEDLVRSVAQAANIYDAMSQTNPQNAREFSNQFMGVKLDVKELGPDMMEELAPAIQNNGKGGSVLTWAQVAQGLRGNSTFQTMRREYQDSMEAEERSRQAEAARKAQEEQQKKQG